MDMKCQAQRSAQIMPCVLNFTETKNVRVLHAARVGETKRNVKPFLGWLTHSCQIKAVHEGRKILGTKDRSAAQLERPGEHLLQRVKLNGLFHLEPACWRLTPPCSFDFLFPIYWLKNRRPTGHLILDYWLRYITAYKRLWAKANCCNAVV